MRGRASAVKAKKQNTEVIEVIVFFLLLVFEKGVRTVHRKNLPNDQRGDSMLHGEGDGDSATRSNLRMLLAPIDRDLGISIPPFAHNCLVCTQTS